MNNAGFCRKGSCCSLSLSLSLSLYTHTHTHTIWMNNAGICRKGSCWATLRPADIAVIKTILKAKKTKKNDLEGKKNHLTTAETAVIKTMRLIFKEVFFFKKRSCRQKKHFTTADTAVKTMSLIFKAKKRNDLEGKKK